ncbi:hypothetical protein [Croceicoccus hydrothermalis]|uniref:hypothetical protein n=1 Tax=Croceicoccus hydrothermalis TaxID=2867964 RepID=UPI001EFB0849|nr:hypothetical protein [Croceicoccus hydrothermalis]
MIQFIIALAAIIVMVAMSFRANSRFRDSDRLPMQWSFGGEVNWTAPRAIALAFTPALATLVLIAASASTVMLEPRAGQEGMEVPVIVILATGFIAVHAFHIWLIGKAMNRKDR